MTNNNKKPSVIDKLDPKTQILLVVLEIHLFLIGQSSDKFSSDQKIPQNPAG